MQPRAGILLSSLLAISPGFAGEVNVTNAQASCRERMCNISATLQHPDEGWKHYANHWRVVTPAGEEIARRVLYHPHVDEQPFTRSQSEIRIPHGTEYVWIEGHDSIHKYGGKRFKLQIK